MLTNPLTGELESLDFEYIHQQIPEINRLALDVVPISITKPIDSSQMQPNHWIELVALIAQHHARVDGIVILHGTDTMAFTASALSFMIQDLGKPIVLTGSQLPVGVLRSDGKENLLAALEIAGNKHPSGKPVLTEVAVFFQSKLFRGNRVSKISAHQFDAFDAPNYPLLGSAGVEITIHEDRLIPYRERGPAISTNLNTNVGLVKLYPGIDLAAYASVFNTENHKAVVLEAYGAGNTPNHPEFELPLKEYIAAGGILVTITQCTSGSVQPGKYASGHLLSHLGAWNGTDLTSEAAITKLMWLLANTQRLTQEFFLTPLAGENT